NDTKTIQELIDYQGPPPNIQDFAPDVSGATAFVINRCLEKDPDARYQSYDELIEHLEYAQSQSGAAPLAAAAVEKIPAVGEEVVRRAWIWGAAASMAAVLVVGIAFLAMRPKSSNEAVPAPQPVAAVIPVTPAI